MTRPRIAGHHIHPGHFSMKIPGQLSAEINNAGVYRTAEERTPIVSVRLASELPAAEQPRFEYLSTESATFARYADAIANRRDPFFIVPAGGADICNVRVPVRRSPATG